METRMLAHCKVNKNNPQEQQVIEMCFDAHTIKDFKPGLKMIYALNDAPLFVKLEEITTDLKEDFIHCR